MTQNEAIEKALKLLRLSKSSNEHEAALAASKAQEIMDKFKLDISDVNFDQQQTQRDSEEVKDFGVEDPLVDFRGPSDKRYVMQLAVVITRANQCRIIRHQNGHDVRLRVLGCPSDVQTVRYIYAYLLSEVERLIKEHCAGNSTTYKRNFGLGIVDTISIKIASQQKRTQDEMRGVYSHNPMALVKVNNAIARIEKRTMAVQKAVEDICGKRKGRMGGGCRTNEGVSARYQGRKAGEQVRFTSARGALGSIRKQIN